MNMQPPAFIPWKWIVSISALLIVMTGAPYLYGYVNTPPGGAYTGLHALTPGDFNVYFAQMRQAHEGTLATHNLFSGREGIGSISMANPLWQALGVLGGALHLSPPIMFHLARLLLIPVFLIALWQLIALLLPHRTRVVAGAVVLFSSGIGYFLYPFVPHAETPAGVYAFPMDLWVPESNTFLTLSHSPHLLLALTLFVWILVCFLRAHAAARPFSWQVMGGLTAAVLFSFHPFHIPTLAAVLGAWAIVLGRAAGRRSCATLFVFAALSAPSIGWQAARLLTDEITLDWARQNITLTPPPWDVSAGFGLLLPLAVFGFMRFRRGAGATVLIHNGRVPWLLMAWAVVQLALVYSPFPFQRRLLQGVHVPLALLATEGIVWVAAVFPRTLILRSFAIVLLGLLLTTSTVGTVSRDVALFSARNPIFYLSSPLQEVFRTLETDPHGGVVIAGMTTASFIPAWTGRVVFAAPGAHSFHYDVARRVKAYWFLLGKGTYLQRKEFLVREYISDVVITPVDSIDAQPLLRDPLLRLKFTQDGVYWFIPAKQNLL